MKNSLFGKIIACTGAVVGAGFASGREVMTFFTRYGSHAWWLMILASAAMTALCYICLQSALKKGVSAQLCVLVLMLVTGGAMTAAAGHMVEMVLPIQRAGLLGRVVTLWTAWKLSYASLKPMEWLSGVLTAMLLTAMVVLLIAPASQTPVVFNETLTFSRLGKAALHSIAYAAMNLTLATGIVSRCAQKKQNTALAVGFGSAMALLLFFSQLLYSRHPECQHQAFPLVGLLSRFGRAGFWMSAAVLYLSVFTSLTAVVYALRCAVQALLPGTVLPMLLTNGILFWLSGIGFSGIVDRLYAPAGLLCLLLVFLPMAKHMERLDKAGRDRVPSISADVSG